MSFHSESESDTLDIDGKTRQNYVWKTVHVSVHCPSRGFNQLVTIVDPVSRWIFAESVPAGNENIPNFIANFMFKTFCCFGFPKIELYNFNSIQFELITQEYIDIVNKANEIIPELKILQTDILLKSNGENWIESELANHMIINPNEASTSIWLLKLRLKQNEVGITPFQTIFARKVVEKSNLDVKQTRRKLQSSLLHCRHCEETFTSKISFRIHQRRHTEEARIRGQKEGEATVRQATEEEEEVAADGKKKSPTKVRKVGSGRTKMQKRKRLARLAETWSQTKNEYEDAVKAEVSEQAAGAVQALLQATREERLKRGKYLRYTPELRDEIAEYAIANGQATAAQHYSNKLNTVVAESSVRNFVRVLQSFPHQLRYEIGTHASEHGLEATSKYYSIKLDQEVTKGMVRRFRKQYGGPGKNNKRRLVGKSGKIYSQALREEIGRYASQHGVEATIQVYSDKLLVAVKPSTVRKFRQLYGDSAPQNLSYIQLSESSSTTIDLLHSSMNVLNQNGGPYIPNYVVPANNTQPVFMNQQYTGFPMSLVMDQHGTEVMNASHDSIVNANIDNTQTNGQYHNNPSTSENNPDKAQNNTPDTKEEILANSDKVKGKSGNKKPSRGRYVQYTPELRAKIGKYALKHGNTAAMKHFQAEFGHDIPESTIRGMRDKYQIMSERNGEGVSEVGCGPRGRPVSLGHHDSLVQVAVKKLQDKGEKVNAFVVIAIAKQVIMQQDPSILQEFGGQVKLNTTWAKSMLRRLGIKSKS
eukprot:GFUD01007206.1.p1 GENE.GFUD01007206.1~~GFUD01007206.1.p1  ORF type:complete len:760 (+),score=126.41 GFUD01007206.1:122-2401(+)